MTGVDHLESAVGMNQWAATKELQELHIDYEQYFGSGMHWQEEMTGVDRLESDLMLRSHSIRRVLELAKAVYWN
jgi:hypothetical protein